MKHISIIIFLVAYFILGFESVSQLMEIIPNTEMFELWFLFSSYIISYILIAIFLFNKVWKYDPDTDIFKNMKESDSDE